jgi:uncharacterized protein (UPF0332 family)
LKDEIAAMLEAARHKLRASRLLLGAGEYGDAASRAYYAVYHSISALHLTQDRTYSSHAQAIGKFNKFYVKEGVFPQVYAKTIARLFEDRQTGDYGIAPGVTQSEAEQDVVDAEQIVQAIRLFIGECSFEQDK